MEETGCETICGAPAALMVKGQMMMMMMKPGVGLIIGYLVSLFCRFFCEQSGMDTESSCPRPETGKCIFFQVPVLTCALVYFVVIYFSL